MKDVAVREKVLVVSSNGLRGLLGLHVLRVESADVLEFAIADDGPAIDRDGTKNITAVDTTKKLGNVALSVFRIPSTGALEGRDVDLLGHKIAVPTLEWDHDGVAVEEAENTVIVELATTKLVNDDTWLTIIAVPPLLTILGSRMIWINILFVKFLARPFPGKL